MQSFDIPKIIENSLDEIYLRWSQSPSSEPILYKLKASRDEHRHHIAEPALAHLLTILKKEKDPGDCPVIRDLVETFYLSGLAVEDIFLHCTTLKNILTELLVSRQAGPEARNELAAVLDANLYQIISLYTKKQREQEKRHKLYSQIIEEHVVLTATDTKGTITYVTDAFCDLSGFSKQELIGKTHQLIRHPEMKPTFFEGMWKQITEGHSWKGKIKNRTKDGGEFIAKTEIIPVKDDTGNLTEYIAIRHDITEKELSAYDQLTKLYNRRAFERQLKKAMASNTSLSLMVIDLDNFKKINDTFGHSVGDTVIKACGRIISDSLAEFDTAARWGGEEFVVSLPNSTLHNTELIAESIRKRVEEALIIDPNTPRNDGQSQSDPACCKITCSIGVTQYQKHDNLESFFDRADRNLYKAKQEGRNRVVGE